MLKQQEKEARRQQAAPAVTREIVIRIKPLTEASREVIVAKRKNPMLQLRQQVVVSGPDEDPKTVRDIIRLIAEKWDLRQREVELRLCFSPADIVQKDLRHLPKFDKASSLKAKLQDIIKHDQARKDQPIYMLYDIKRPSLEDTSESVDTEEEEELNEEDS